MFKFKKKPSFPDIVEQASSRDRAIRARAMTELLIQAKEDPSVQSAVLEIFRGVLQTESDSLIAVEVARGLSVLASPAEGRAAWLALIHHADEQLAVSAIFALSDASYGDELLEILAHRKEPRLQAAALFSLGKMRDRRAFSAIVERLSIPTLKSEAIDSLGALGDVRAIPYLEPLLSDETLTGKCDERGYPWKVNDIAHAAIRQIRAANPAGRSA